MMKRVIIEFFFLRFNVYLMGLYYPHHPQPKLAIKTMLAIRVAIKYLSSNAMISPP